MQEKKLKFVPSVDGLEVNEDGSAVYYYGKFKQYCYARNVQGKKYKYINLGNKRYAISRLVYEAFVGKMPPGRKLGYIDKDCNNTHYTNLSPRRCEAATFTDMKPVPGYDELMVNANGTVVSQHGFEISISLQKDNRFKNKEVPAVCVYRGKRSKYTYIDIIVGMAWLGYDGKGKIFHRDGNVKNNHYTNLDCMSLEEYGRRANEYLKGNKHKNVSRSIPKSDYQLVKERIKNGENLSAIAHDYGCSDMSILRFKKRHFSKEEINRINNAKGINANYMSNETRSQVIERLNKGERQIDIANDVGISASQISRIKKLINVDK